MQVKEFFSNRSKLGAILVLVLILITVFSKGHKAKNESHPSSETINSSVLVEASEVKEFKKSVSILGNIEPKTQIKIVPKTTGTITEILVAQGQNVKKNQLIAKIEAEEKPLDVSKAEQSLKVQKSKLELNKTLLKTGGISQFGLDISEEQYRDAQSALEKAKKTLGFTQITAPISGYVDKINVKVGDYVNPSSNLVITQIFDATEFIVKIFIAQSQIGDLKVGQKAEVLLPDGQVIESILSFVSSMAQLGTLSYYGEITLNGKNAAELIRFSGFPVDVKIFTKDMKAIELPSSAVMIGKDNSSEIKTIDDQNKVQRIPIEILSSIESGNVWVSARTVWTEKTVNVITRGAGFVNEGEKVDVEVKKS